MQVSRPKRPFFLYPSRPADHGFALVLVLAFVVLVVGVCLAFFSNSSLQAQISNSSATQVKTNLLANGAVDMVICDLRAEIATGSNDITPTGSSTKVYEPKSPADMVPYRLPDWQGKDELNNLVKISGQTFHPGVSIADSGIETTEASANGRKILSTRWLEPLFLPPSAGSDRLPNEPKWINITRDGSAKSSEVMGRYAFVIYDEGGLLDLNVAGYPSTPTSLKWDPAKDPSYKSALAYADLTQLGNGLLTQANVDDLVNWRNAASLDAPGYKKYVEANNVGFMRTANTDLVGTKSDQMFVGRQQMISFLVDKLGWNKDTLQYFTSFSRAINQPSYTPNPNRPKIVGGSYSTAYQQGGNDGCKNDDKINPSFSALRVTNGFTRNDGTYASPGGPLVKTRFALNRLAWLTYRGPSANRNTSAPGKTGDDGDIWRLENLHGISKEWLAKGTPTNIRKYFGLNWNSAGYWEYTDGAIKRLDSVTGREANFFELLKAAINAGSIAKDYKDDRNNESAYETQNFRPYTSVDRSIFQIGANIISQASVDGYPAWIRSNYPGVSQPLDVFGIENLPFLYRLRNAVFTTDKTGDGKWVLLQEPEVWNPHAWNPSDTDASAGYPAPTQLQLNATSLSPISVRPVEVGKAYVDTAKPLSLNATLSFNNAASLYREPTLLLVPGIPANGAEKSDLTGKENTGDGNRALPITAYGRPSLYNGRYPAPLASTSTNQYVGFPLSWGICKNASNKANQVRVDPGDPFTVDVHYQLSCVGPFGSIPYDQKVGRTLTGTNFLSGFYLDVDKTGQANWPSTGPEYQGDLIPLGANWTMLDPRTARFGFVRNNQHWRGGGYIPPPYTNGNRWVYRQQNMMESARPDGSAGYMVDGVNPNAWDGPPKNDSSQGWKTSGTAYRLGLFSQNALAVSDDGKSFAGDSPQITTGSQTIYADADSVVRRAMGGYVTTSGSDATGLPMAVATSPSSFSPSYAGSSSRGTMNSRPVVLNRPFHSVAELGYVFSDTPWKNLDMSMPESGSLALLDVFCTQEADNPEGLVAGKVNLNTRQPLVLKAILSGAYMDEYGKLTPMLDSVAGGAADALVKWTSTTTTTSGQGPLLALSDLVGGDLAAAPGSGFIDGSDTANYTGFSTKLGELPGVDANFTKIPRMREAPIRALAAVGQTRTWNLMIDLIAQTGRSRDTGGFVVDGEQRYWVHVALDRLTGKVLDLQVEVVQE